MKIILTLTQVVHIFTTGF